MVTVCAAFFIIGLLCLLLQIGGSSLILRLIYSVVGMVGIIGLFFIFRENPFGARPAMNLLLERLEAWQSTESPESTA